MKCLVLVALIIASSDAFLKSGTLNLSGSFQAHPILANHPFLANHKLFGSQPKPVETPVTTTVAPVIVEAPTTQTTVAVQSDASAGSSATGSSHSFHSKIDVHKILNDIVGLKVLLLKQVQQGINDKFDSKLRRLEKFETHVKNHFNKNSAAASTSTVNVASDATINKSDNVVTVDAKVSVNNDSRFAPEINVITHENSSSDSHDFDLADSSLNAYKSASPSGRDPLVSNCDH
ncbi:uncharacterized protein [Chironomus tepperi]|uniref:uncharacterized protein n=1 Tax=Chironomus tepperi TaxID=113505 RepID=UPI00391F0F65